MRPPAFDPARPDLVRPVRVDPSGIAGPTRAQARGRRWRRTGQGFYVPVDVDGSLPEQRIVEAGHGLDGFASVTGWAALRWMGAEWFDGRCQGGRVELPVGVAILHGALRSQPGVSMTSEFIPARDRIIVDGLPVTVPVCATSFEMRYAEDVRAAVRALGMAAAADLVSVDEMREYAELLYHWTGIPLQREATDLADENWWSPAEVDLHLTWRIDAALPPALANRPVFDVNGRHVGTPDLLDVEAGVVGEYDGRMHLLGRRRARDLEREDAYRAVGLEYFTVVASDRGDTARIVARMLATRARAARLPATNRRWTIEQPPWWVPTHTVELRRGLSPSQKSRYLGYRRTA